MSPGCDAIRLLLPTVVVDGDEEMRTLSPLETEPGDLLEPGCNDRPGINGLSYFTSTVSLCCLMTRHVQKMNLLRQTFVYIILALLQKIYNTFPVKNSSDDLAN